MKPFQHLVLLAATATEILHDGLDSLTLPLEKQLSLFILSYSSVVICHFFFKKAA
jgi:hypothetical protein